jgi:hypothetical protein
MIHFVKIVKLHFFPDKKKLKLHKKIFHEYDVLTFKK